MSLDPGEKLGRFNIASQIGVGGMGEVYLAEDPTLERKVAIKILGGHIGEDPERLARFEREARSASALNHPNILTIYEITDSAERRYIVSEFVDGETLKSRMKASRLAVLEALDIAIQTASALAAAHEAGIVHRDIKPANIMIRRDGIVKVVDFGIAKLIKPDFDPEVHGESPTLSKFGTEPGMMIGTPKYMSPEQARGGSVDHRSDIFSFGLVLFEMLTGKRAFEGEQPVEVISSILKDDAPALRSLEPGLPPELERLVEKCLRKDKENRYQHIRDLLIDLEDIREDLKFEKKLGLGGRTQTQSFHETESDTGGTTGSITATIVKTRRFSLLHLFGMAGLLLALVAAYFLYDWTTREPTVFSGNAKISEIASWSSAPGELFSKARFSPDGKLIAFSSTRSGAKDIWVTQANSTDAIQITKDEFANTDPVWSPDGSQIAYFSINAVGGSRSGSGASLWKVSALGGTPRSVGVFDDGSSELRRWTSQGNVIFQSKGELFAMNATTGETSKITKLDKVGGEVIWADITNDEDRLAFVVRPDEKTWVLTEWKLDGSASRELLRSETPISSVVWVQASDTFYYSAEVDGTDQVFGLAAGASQGTQITNNPTSSLVVDASADGSAVLFTSVREESNIWKVGLGNADESPVARGINSELWPSVSPRGDRVAYESIRNLDRGNKLLSSSLTIRPMTAPKGDDEGITVAKEAGLPVWSPDGSQLAFVRLDDKGHSLWVVSSTGGEEARLAGPLRPIAYSISPYNRVQVSEIAWHPDGTRIAFAKRNDSGSVINLVKVDAPSSARTVSPPGEGYAQYCPVFSDDGKKLAFYSQRSRDDKITRAISYLDMDSGETTRLVETERLVRLVGWAPDGKSVIVAEASRFSSLPPETTLWNVGQDGQFIEIARLQNAYYYNIFLSPDMARIAYAARNADLDDLWVIASAGGTPRKVTDNKDSETYFSALAWAPDNSSILFGKQTRFSLLSKLTDLKK